MSPTCCSATPLNSMRIRELEQLRGELRHLAERAATLDPEQCPPERVCHIIG